MVRGARRRRDRRAAPRVADLRRPLEPHLLDRRRHPRVGAAPAAARPRAADRARHGPRAHGARRARRHRRARAPHARVLRRRRGERRAVLRDGESRRRDPAHAGRARRALRRRRAPLLGMPDRRARRDPRGRLPTRSGSASSGTPTATSSARFAAGASSGSGRSRSEIPAIDELARRLRAALPDLAAAHDRARRLPPRQHDARRRRSRAASSRCSTGRWRRSAIRSPTSACSSSTGAATRATFAGANPSMTPDAGFLSREEVAERYANASGRDVSQLDFYEMLASYKLAIILAGIHARLPDGQDRRRRLRPHRHDGRDDRRRRARERCSRSSIPALRG